MTIVEALRKVIRKHLPSTREESESRARILLICDRYAVDRFGVSKDVEKLKEIEQSLRHAVYLSRSLEFSTIRTLGSPLAMNTDEMGEPFEQFVERADETSKAIAEMRANYKRFVRPASAKPNWRAMSIAKGCCEIWAADVWRRDPEKYGPEPYGNALSDYSADAAHFNSLRLQRTKYDAHVDAFRPPMQEHGKSGPFGRFLEDVFLCLGILAKSGKPVSANTALSALRRFEAKEKSGV